MRDVNTFIGTIALVVALSEAHLRLSRYVGWALVILCVTWRSLLLFTSKKNDTPAKELKLWLAIIAVACLLGGYNRLFRVLLFVNVMACAVPPLYRANVPLTMIIIWLALLTPSVEHFDSKAGILYMWSFFVILSVFYTLSDVTRAHAVSLLVSVLPMGIGLLVHARTAHAGTAAAAYRCIGMLIVFMLPTIWHICSPLEASPFRKPIDGKHCNANSFAENVDRLRYSKPARCVMYTVCTIMLVVATIEASKVTKI